MQNGQNTRTDVLGNTINPKESGKAWRPAPSARLQAELVLGPLVCLDAALSHFTLFAQLQPQTRCCRNEHQHIPALKVPVRSIGPRCPKTVPIIFSRVAPDNYTKSRSPRPKHLVRVCERPVVERENEMERGEGLRLSRQVDLILPKTPSALCVPQPQTGVSAGPSEVPVW